MRTEDSDSGASAHEPAFATTHWSVILAAGQSTDAQAGAALEQLCRTYWYPLYAYVRRRGYGHEDAQDLTQGFLAQLLERRSLARVDRSKGRFRSFLLAALNYFMADEYDRAAAQKRRWIRTSGKFGAVIDFDAVVRNPVTLTNLLSAYDSGDGLHLNPAGYEAMAHSIDLHLFAHTERQ